MADRLPGEMRIGEVLQDARERAGLDLRTVEERTKIRIKYLRALESEDWDALPSPAYAKGFLRTYAQLLGLDDEALTDEFRRQVEPDRGSGGYPLGDKVLESRRRHGGDRGGRGLTVAIAAAALVVLALVLVIVFGGDDADDGPAGEPRRAERRGDRDREGSKGTPTGGTVTVALSVIDPVEVCLLGGGGEALIDGQVLAAGTEESYKRREFELRFPKGFDADQFRLEIAGERRTLPKANGPAAYEIVAPRRVDELPPPGERCP